MTVMVDELRQWPTQIRCFKPGSCHLTTDGELDELHAFAKQLGLRRAWFQEHAIAPHYDLTIKKREKAIELGAVFVSAREQATRRHAAIVQARMVEGATEAEVGMRFGVRREYVRHVLVRWQAEQQRNRDEQLKGDAS